MAGLVPAIPLRQAPVVRQFYLYILASRPGGAIYIGVTSDLVRRVYQHKNKLIKGFTSQYDDITAAIEREKELKKWRREWRSI